MSPDTTSATAILLALRPCRQSDLLALADVEILVGGVSFVLHGVQLRANAQKTEVRLPSYREPGGEWKAALSLPDELRDPIAQVVITAGLEAGILKNRDAST
jgi:stage V sporulation protein G